MPVGAIQFSNAFSLPVGAKKQQPEYAFFICSVIVHVFPFESWLVLTLKIGH